MASKKTTDKQSCTKRAPNVHVRKDLELSSSDSDSSDSSSDTSSESRECQDNLRRHDQKVTQVADSTRKYLGRSQSTQTEDARTASYNVIAELRETRFTFRRLSQALSPDVTSKPLVIVTSKGRKGNKDYFHCPYCDHKEERAQSLREHLTYQHISFAYFDSQVVLREGHKSVSNFLRRFDRNDFSSIKDELARQAGNRRPEADDNRVFAQRPSKRRR